MPLDARCFLISLSVPYQLKPLVECPMRGRCTLASRRRMKNKPTGKLEKVVHWYKKKKEGENKCAERQTTLLPVIRKVLMSL